MSRALGIAIAILPILHSYVSAQAPTCLPGYSSLFNSLNQSPCTMTVALGGACTNIGFTLDPLQPGFEYLGPTQIGATPCRCSTVYYSLLSACAVCQNQSYLDWSIYNVNCTTVYTEVFPDPIPASIRIPHYAYLDVVTDNTFNVTIAENAGGPESTPGAQPTGSSAAIATSTSTAKATAKSSKSNAGAIAGGIIGGVVFLGIAAGLAFIIMRRRKSRPSQPTSAYSSVPYNSVTSPESMMAYAAGKDDFAMPAPMVSGRVYDPNDPTTFPTHDPVGYNTYSASPDFNQQGPVTPSFTGNATLVTPVAPGRTQYTGAPEL